MNNAQLYAKWIREREVEGVPMPDEQGFFVTGRVSSVLPFLRVYWSDRPSPSAPLSPAPWEPETWLPAGEGVVRFLRADQALDCLQNSLGARTSTQALSLAIKRVLAQAWLLAVEDVTQDALATLKRRVETVRLTKRRRQLRWSRAVRTFPDSLRASLSPGLDAVHTPESSHAGLTRYLCEGWSIDDAGALRAEPGAEMWGPSTRHVPHRLHDAPRRLMLGASLQARAVSLVESESPADWSDADQAPPPGRSLVAALVMHGGWTHEDAIVVSESAARALARPIERSVTIRIPAVAVHVDLGGLTVGSWVDYGQVLARAFVDAFALNLRRHDAAALGADGSGWIEVGLPRAFAPISGSVVDLRSETVRSPLWRESITFTIRRSAPAGVGDKLSTRHGIKGVVSQVLPDDQMPLVDDVRADVVFSPLGIIRRGAMGQMREAGVGGRGGAPRAGRIFVMRQRQDADSPERCRARGPERDGALAVSGRGQRYGEMEFWALMAHGVPDVAMELLSAQRSTARWLDWEAKIAPGNHRQLATHALNRYLSVAGIHYSKGQLIAVSTSHDTEAVDIRRSLTAGANTRDLLEDPERFVQRNGRLVLSLGETVKVRVRPRSDVEKRVILEVSHVPVLPPWLRPSSPTEPHRLTRAYKDLIDALTLFPDDTGRLRRAVRSCVNLALDEKLGVGGFLRREVLGRRLTRSARAVIVPRPDLRIDQVAIPSRLADRLFANLDASQRRLVLVNRNPTLHRRGVLALRPVVESSAGTSAVIGLPLGILRALGADFDGDQATVVALETESALGAAERLLPGAEELRVDTFRPGRPAFPFSGELVDDADPREAALLADDAISQEEWCEQHHALLSARLGNLGDGWSHPLVTRALSDEANASLWAGLEEDEWRARAAQEMSVIYRSVRRKGRFGGVLRREFYKRRYVGDKQFWRAVHALQAVTERATQAALSTKTGEGTNPFAPSRYFSDPASGTSVKSLQRLDPTLDARSVAEALGESQEPGGVLAWMAGLEPAKLFEAASKPASCDPRDSRISWFLD